MRNLCQSFPIIPTLQAYCQNPFLLILGIQIPTGWTSKMAVRSLLLLSASREKASKYKQKDELQQQQHFKLSYIFIIEVVATCTMKTAVLQVNRSRIFSQMLNVQENKQTHIPLLTGSYALSNT